tara:strand:+ start:735 stop:1157 length:423 start_codon:yes stop_codon:yes gene_type:complete
MAKRGITCDESVILRIVDEMAEGTSLLRICKASDMPAYRTVTKAVARDTNLWDLYAKGRRMQAEYLADHIQEIAMSPLPEGMDPRFLNAEVQRRRLEVDSLKWTLARIQPYGLRDKREDANTPSSITLTWANGEVVADNV